MSVGIKLRELRKERNWTLEDASKFLDIKTSTLAGYEREFRKPDIYILAEIASKYNVSVDYIVGLTDDREIKKVESNVYEYFKKDGINWKGIPLSKEQLRPIEDILDMVINRLEDNSPKKNNLNNKKEYYI